LVDNLAASISVEFGSEPLARMIKPRIIPTGMETAHEIRVSIKYARKRIQKPAYTGCGIGSNTIARLLLSADGSPAS